MNLDSLDSKALRLLTDRGRATWAELAQQLNLSAPAAADRVRRLEERGIIRGYAALIEPASVGYPLTAYVSVSLDRPQHRFELLDYAKATGEVAECHHVAGDEDYLLKFRCRGTEDLDRLLIELKNLNGVSRTRATVVLSTAKESVAVPIEDSAG
jgi:Lrp/AsnC family leucine-responsive transcriptional regulator